MYYRGDEEEVEWQTPNFPIKSATTREPRGIENDGPELLIPTSIGEPLDLFPTLKSSL